MANLNCEACEDLRQDAPNFIVNGLGEEECASLQNDTGLSPSSGNNDCEDLNNMNDWLVDNMVAEVNAYNNCEWKTFMKKLIPNLWSVFKAIICAVCGIWTNIHDLWTYVRRLQCLINYLFDGASFRIAEDSDEDSHLVAGRGVDFSIRSKGSEHTSDVTLLYVAGGFARLSGSLRCFASSYKDAKGNDKSGNSVWNLNDRMPSGGELLLEVRIKKSEHPQIKKLYQGWGFPLNGHDVFYEVITNIFDGDDKKVEDGGTACNSDGYVYAYGQHGWCDSCGAASDTDTETGLSDGHRVPKGWVYIQMRLAYKGTMTSYTVKDGANADKTGFNITPLAQFGIRMDRGKIDC